MKNEFYHIRSLILVLLIACFLVRLKELARASAIDLGLKSSRKAFMCIGSQIHMKGERPE